MGEVDGPSRKQKAGRKLFFKNINIQKTSIKKTYGLKKIGWEDSGWSEEVQGGIVKNAGWYMLLRQIR